MFKGFILCMLCCFGIGLLSAHEAGSDKDIFESYMKTVRAAEVHSISDLMDETAKFFLGVPYVEMTLEHEPEKLIVNLREFDCLTYVENVLALAGTYASADPSWHTFIKNLEHLRYRNGEIVNYTSRLHYTSDWIYENQKTGAIVDMTPEIGGVHLDMVVSFMSTHPENHVQLQNHPEYIEMMANKEKEINSRRYYYIPKEDIGKCNAQIHTGDIVCFVSSLKGLDISHVGIIHKEGAKMTFIHASSRKKKVIMNDESLQDYALNMKKIRGVMVLRPVLCLNAGE